MQSILESGKKYQKYQLLWSNPVQTVQYGQPLTAANILLWITSATL